MPRHSFRIPQAWHFAPQHQRHWPSMQNCCEHDPMWLQPTWARAVQGTSLCTQIPLDSVTQWSTPTAKPLRTLELRSKPLFLWYDYFSCPQLDRRSNQLQGAIDSIPAYVEACAFFFALVPVVENPESSQLFTPSTWSERGWCRLERVCRELSQEESWIMVKGSADLELKLGSGTSMGEGGVGEGKFTVPEDRLKLLPVLLAAVRRKLFHLLRTGDFVGYRVLLNKQAALFRGLPLEEFLQPIPTIDPSDNEDPRSLVAKFFHQNGFTGISQTDHGGWTPLHYAALAGDTLLIDGLLKQQADPNCNSKKGQPRVGLAARTSPLSVSCLFRHHAACRLLISAKARVTAGFLQPPLLMAATANDPEGVRLLCEANCSPDQRNFLAVSAVEAASTYGSLEAIEELVSQQQARGDAIDLSHSLHWAMLVKGGNSEVVHRLLDLKADVNDQSFDWPRRTKALRVLCMLIVLQHRCGNVNTMTTQVYHAEGATPLMFALISSQYEAAASLIANGAKLDLQNARGWTAEDFVRDHDVPDFLQAAFAGGVGRSAECRKVSRLSLQSNDDGYVAMYL
ncbi:Putative ankyrin repeat protein RF_0381 [Durusdinium trenchii]|uniref:Ankyrin repeat protein RF_0381 n=1 Tax=Durusdinium trenchii TaxID=1381693 RepID=A0ABP0KQT6_9DINO